MCRCAPSPGLPEQGWGEGEFAQARSRRLSHQAPHPEFCVTSANSDSQAGRNKEPAPTRDCCAAGGEVFAVMVVAVNS
jgi:hypothetical protein